MAVNRPVRCQSAFLRTEYLELGPLLAQRFRLGLLAHWPNWPNWPNDFDLVRVHLVRLVRLVRVRLVRVRLVRLVRLVALVRARVGV